jgi:hypothetical protein
VSWQTRITVLVLAVLTGSSAGCSGKSMSYENLKRVKPNMTLEEVQAVLGSGSEATSEDIAKATQNAGARAPGQLTYRAWKDSKTLLVLGFQNNKMAASYFTTTDPNLSEEMRKDREQQEREARRAEPSGGPPGGSPTAPPGGAGEDPQAGMPTADEGQLHFRMSALAGQLTTFADTHGSRLPANLQELEQWGNWSVFPPDVQKAVRSGEFVVAWGAKWDRFDNQSVIAWEKSAPEKGGFAAKATGVAEKYSAAELKARMPRK